MINQIVIVCFSGALGGILGAILSYQFNKRLEGIKREQLIKDKASAIAELFAKLHNREGFDPKERAFECTKISYELSLYLPTDLYKLISQKTFLNKQATSEDWHEVLRLVKNHLHNTKEDEPIQAVLWTTKSFGNS